MRTAILHAFGTTLSESGRSFADEAGKTNSGGRVLNFFLSEKEGEEEKKQLSQTVLQAFSEFEQDFFQADFCGCCVLVFLPAKKAVFFLEKKS